MTEGSEKLREFAAFAAGSPADALKLFKTDAFLELLAEGDHRGRAMWRGLMKPPVTPLSMEEFLVGMGLKPSVAVSADVTEAEFYDLRDSIQDVIGLRRDGYGSFFFNVRTDCDFIELPRRRVTDDDFVASSCDVEYRILIGKLGEGIRRGKIYLESQTQTIVFSVAASRRARGAQGARQELDANTLRILKTRLDYMIERMSRRAYVDETLAAIEERYCMTSGNLALIRLYHAYLERLSGNAEEASAILREFRGQSFAEEEAEEEMACLYLRSLLGESGLTAEETAERIRSRFDAGYGGYVMLKLLFLTNPDIGRYPRRRKKAAEEVYARGVRSPLLYAEMLRDLRKEDALVTQLSDFMVSVLLYAAKEDLLTEQLALRAAYLSASEKCFSAPLLKVLTSAYEKWPLDGILEAIVRVLMKGQPRDGRCFPWYEKAVERNLRVIRLYEYYIETLPESRKAVLPLAVRKYFVMSAASVSEESRAAVYANIVRNRQTDPETYAATKEKAGAFARDALKRGRIGAHYAALYQHFIRGIPEEGMAEKLAEAVCAVRLYTDDPKVRSVTVVHDGLIAEETVPLVRGSACLHLYTEDAQIFFENALTGRYFTGAAYSLTQLMDRSEFLPLLKKAESAGDGFLLAELRGLEAREAETGEEFRLLKKAAESEALDEDERRASRAKVLRYLTAHPESSFFHHGTDPETMQLYAEADLTALVRTLFTAGLYGEAYGVLLRCGTEDIPEDLLVRIARHRIDETGGAENPELASFAMDVFRRGKYDEGMLAYLAEFGTGEMDVLLELRRCADSFYIDTFALDDRILAMAVKEKSCIEDGPEILDDYASRGGRRALVRAYLELYAGAAVFSGEDVNRHAAERIAEIYDRGEPVDMAMKLTLLKYRSQQKTLTAHEELQVDALLLDAMKRDIRLKFMQDLPESFIREYGLSGRTIVEARAEVDDEVLIRYCRESCLPGEEKEVRTEAMTHRFRGIFTKEFQLFYGETIRYETVVRRGEEETVSESVTASARQVPMTGAGSCARINRMMRAAKEGNEAALREEIRSYQKAKETVQSLFVLEGTF